VGAVAVTIAGFVIAQIIGVEPVVVMVEGAAIVAAILPNQGLVRVAHTGINVGNHQTGPFKTQRPDIVCIDMGEVGLNGFGVVINDRCCGIRFIQDERVPGVDGFNFREIEQAIQRGQVGAFDQDGVLDPVGLVFHIGARQICSHICLGLFGNCRERIVDIPTALCPAHVIGGREVSFGFKVDPVAGGALGFHVAQHSRINCHRRLFRRGLLDHRVGRLDQAEDHPNQQQDGEQGKTSLTS